jgi:hypothetical protein
MMPVVLRADIVLGRDDLLVEQDETILIDEIRDDRQYQQWNQEEQDRSPECLHILSAFCEALHGTKYGRLSISICHPRARSRLI